MGGVVGWKSGIKRRYLSFQRYRNAVSNFQCLSPIKCSLHELIFWAGKQSWTWRSKKSWYLKFWHVGSPTQGSKCRELALNYFLIFFLLFTVRFSWSIYFISVKQILYSWYVTYRQEGVCGVLFVCCGVFCFVLGVCGVLRRRHTGSKLGFSAMKPSFLRGCLTLKIHILRIKVYNLDIFPHSYVHNSIKNRNNLKLPVGRWVKNCIVAWVSL